MMKILVGYDGSDSADAVLDDLRRAGVPREVEALIVSVGEVMMPPSSAEYEVAGPPVTSQRLSMGCRFYFVGGRKFSGLLERFRLGSVSTAVVTNAHCSVEVERTATN
jgi:nucleotide-binding universal stress UspA family protein